MAFPADVKLVRVTCGTGYDFSGDPIAITLEVTPVLGGSLKRLIHAATGTFMTRDALTFKSDPGSPATFTVPSPAQAETWKDGSGEFFTNWSYSVKVTTRTASGKVQSWIQSFQPVDGQETVDLDLVPDGQIGLPTSAPAPAVTSVNGQSGAVVIDGGEAVTPDSVAANLTVEAVDAKLPERLSESALSAAIDASVSPLPAVQPTLARLKRNAEDVTILVVSDSTATDPWEWVRLTADTLADRWPTHSVHYYLWNYSGEDWPASPEVVSAGTGPHILRIYNFSYAGWSTNHARSHYAKGVEGINNPSLVVVSHGHNEPYGSGNPVPGSEIRIALANFMEQVAATHPSADLVMVAQNPDTGKVAEHSHRASIIQEICRMNSYGFIDVCQHFLDAGMPTSWFLDSTHPNEIGMIEWAKVVARAFTYFPDAGQVSRLESSYMVPWPNLITDGTFETYVGPGLPADYAKSPAATDIDIIKDTSRYDSPKGYSLKLTSEPNNGAIYFTMPTPLYNSLVGQWVTFAARVFTPTGATGNSGRVSYLSSISNTSLAPSNYGQMVRDQWRWQTVTVRIPAGATYSRFYVNTGSEVSIDRVVLVKGMRPHDAA